MNATTGEPGTISKMTIDFVTVRPNRVIDLSQPGSQFTARAVPIVPSAEYIITVYADGVPYWWSKRGRELTAGPVVLHVFDTAPGPEGLTISGMDVILHHDGSVLKLQYMLQVRNDLKPQATVAGSGASFALALPGNAQEVEAVYMRGPDPMPVDVATSGDMAGLTFPVTPGMNKVRIDAVVPWTEGMEVAVGSNLAVENWSVLASPRGLEVRAFGVRDKSDQEIQGYTSLEAEPIDAGDLVDLTLSHPGPASATIEDLFEATEAAEDQAGGEQEESGGGPNYLPLIFLGGLLIVILVGASRRRKK
jgi:hypothetical protein